VGCWGAFLVKGTARFGQRISVSCLPHGTVVPLAPQHHNRTHIWADARFLSGSVSGRHPVKGSAGISVIARGPRLTVARYGTSIAIVLGVCAILYPARATRRVANTGSNAGNMQRWRLPAGRSTQERGCHPPGSQSFLYLNDPQTSLCNIPRRRASGTPNRVGPGATCGTSGTPTVAAVRVSAKRDYGRSSRLSRFARRASRPITTCSNFTLLRRPTITRASHWVLQPRSYLRREPGRC